MMETQLVAFAAFSFGRHHAENRYAAAILEKIMKFAREVWSLVLTTIGTAYSVSSYYRQLLFWR
jgi:Na+/H+ antiporter NhaC